MWHGSSLPQQFSQKGRAQTYQGFFTNFLCVSLKQEHFETGFYSFASFKLFYFLWMRVMVRKEKREPRIYVQE